MSRRKVRETVCDRCPIGKERPATRRETFGIGDQKWEIDLCEDCGNRLDREIYAWGRLGRPVEVEPEGSRFGQDFKERGRRVAELRSRQYTPEGLREVPLPKAGRWSGPVPEGLPAEACEWIFLPHALERLQERKVSAARALRAAVKPTIVREGREGAMVHIFEDVKVVVHQDRKVIVTVAHVDQDDEQNNEYRKAN